MLEELQLVPAAAAASAGPDSQPDEGETPLLTAMGFEPVSLDALQARTGLPTPELQAQLLALELGNQVARLPGGLFQRIALG